MRDVWNPEQYARFQEERSRPFFDLLALVQSRPGLRGVDLGCGTGELTCELHRRLGAASMVGIDASENMLAESARFAAPGLRFEKQDIADFRAQAPCDLIFSNAALQWVPDHEALLARLYRALSEGGQLAIQLPAMQDHVSHQAAIEAAGRFPFRALLEGYVRRFDLLSPEGYAERLNALGFREQTVRMQIYGHLLPSKESVVEWMRGSLLTAYQGRLPAEAFERFVDEYRRILLPQLSEARPFFFPFKRILIWARR